MNAGCQTDFDNVYTPKQKQCLREKVVIPVGLVCINGINWLRRQTAIDPLY